MGAASQGPAGSKWHLSAKKERGLRTRGCAGALSPGCHFGFARKAPQGCGDGTGAVCKPGHSPGYFFEFHLLGKLLFLRNNLDDFN